MNLFALQKIKQKTNIHIDYKINPLKDIHSKYFKQFIVKLFFYYKIYCYFCSPF